MKDRDRKMVMEEASTLYMINSPGTVEFYVSAIINYTKKIKKVLKPNGMMLEHL